MFPCRVAEVFKEAIETTVCIVGKGNMVDEAKFHSPIHPFGCEPCGVLINVLLCCAVSTTTIIKENI